MEDRKGSVSTWESLHLVEGWGDGVGLTWQPAASCKAAPAEEAEEQIHMPCEAWTPHHPGPGTS